MNSEHVTLIKWQLLGHQYTTALQQYVWYLSVSVAVMWQWD